MCLASLSLTRTHALAARAATFTTSQVRRPRSHHTTHACSARQNNAASQRPPTRARTMRMQHAPEREHTPPPIEHDASGAAPQRDGRQTICIGSADHTCLYCSTRAAQGALRRQLLWRHKCSHAQLYGGDAATPRMATPRGRTTHAQRRPQWRMQLHRADARANKTPAPPSMSPAASAPLQHAQRQLLGYPAAALLLADAAWHHGCKRQLSLHWQEGEVGHVQVLVAASRVVMAAAARCECVLHAERRRALAAATLGRALAADALGTAHAARGGARRLTGSRR